MTDRKAEYAELLKDPRWQRRRLERLGASNWTCADCGDDKSSLHVHHTRYFTGRMPWEYEDDLLVVCCDACHSKRHGKEPEKRTPSMGHVARGFLRPEVPHTRRALGLVDAELRRLFDLKLPNAAQLMRARELCEIRRGLKTIDLDAIKSAGTADQAVSARLLAQRAELERREIQQHFDRPEL